MSLRDLLIPARAGPLTAENLVLVGFGISLVTVGWFAAQSLGIPIGLLVAPVTALVLIGAALVAKQVRYPAAPLTGDGFEVFVLIYAGISLIGGALGALPQLRARSSRRALAIAVALISAAALIASVPYLLPEPA